MTLLSSVPETISLACREHAFVVACLARKRSRAASLLKGLDLETAIRFAIRHEVVGELVAFLEDAALGIPAELLNAMHIYLDGFPFSSISARKLTVKLARAFADAGIPVIFAKGAVWDMLYRELSTRRTTKDVDLYLAKADFRRALNVVKSLGCTKTKSSLEASLRRLHHLSIWSPVHSILIEMHWQLAHPRQNLSFDLSNAIANARTIILDGQPVRTLGANEAIVFLSIELSKDSWGSLKKLLDFSECLKRSNHADLVAAVDVARHSGCLRALLISALVVEKLGLAERPSILDGQINADSKSLAVRVADICVEHLMRRDARSSVTFRVRRGLALSRKHDRITAQMYHLWRIIFLYRVRGWLRISHR